MKSDDPSVDLSSKSEGEPSGSQPADSKDSRPINSKLINSPNINTPKLDSIIQGLEHEVSESNSDKIPHHYKIGDYYDTSGMFHKETQKEKLKKQ